MKKILTLLLCFSVFTGIGFGGASAENMDTEAYVISEFNRLNTNITESTLLMACENDARRVTFYASLAAKLYLATGEREYLDISEKAYQSIMSYWANHSQSATNDFFVYGPLAECYEILCDAGWIAKNDETIAAYIHASANGQQGDDNQVFSRCRGLAKALKLFPDSPYSPQWSSYVTGIWDNFLKIGYVNENAAGYNGIGLGAMLEVAQLLGRINELPEKLYSDYAAQIAPSGALPEYGDDYFCEWFFAYPALKNAAAVFERGDFNSLADMVFAFGIHNFPFRVSSDGYKNLEQLMNLYYLSLAFDGGYGEAAAPEFLSQIITRVTPKGQTVPNKLIMNSENGFLMAELYPGGSHGHLNRTGAILYYEVDGVPVYHGMARHNKSATASNVPMVTENGLTCTDDFEPDAWRTESVPLRFVANGNDTVNIPRLTFRIAGTKNITQKFYLDNIRLVGRKGTFLLDGLEDISKWKRSDNPYTLSTDKKTQGESAIEMRIGYNDGGYFYQSPAYNHTVDLAEYDTIQFDWAYTSETNTKEFTFAFRMYDANGNIADFNPGDANLTGALVSAEVDSYEGYSAATLCYDNFYSFDTRLTRTVFLCDDGTLVTTDEYELGTSLENAEVYTIWQLYDTSEKKDGYSIWSGENRNWYDANGILRTAPTLAVKMLGGTITGNKTGYTVTNSNVVSNIVYSGGNLAPGGSMTVVSVITPYQNEGQMQEITDCGGFISLGNDRYLLGGRIVKGQETGIRVDGKSILGECVLRSDTVKKSMVYVAGYDAGKLKRIYMEPKNLEQGVNLITTNNYLNDCEFWKLFVWSEGMNPLTVAKGENINGQSDLH